MFAFVFFLPILLKIEEIPHLEAKKLKIKEAAFGMEKSRRKRAKEKGKKGLDTSRWRGWQPQGRWCDSSVSELEAQCGGIKPHGERIWAGMRINKCTKHSPHAINIC